MIISAELEDEKIIVKKPKDVGRLYNKSHMGKTLSGGMLELDLIESVFLLDEKKIKVFHDKKEIDFETLVKIASEKIDDFERKYLVFKDLRKRGQIVKFNKEKDGFDFYQFQTKKSEKMFYVCVFSEQDLFEIRKTHDLLGKLLDDSVLWFAIVDEEGDITYYSVSHVELAGKNKCNSFKKIEGFVLDDKVLIFDEEKSKELFEKEFFGKPFGSFLQLSFVEVLYLLEKKYINLREKEKKISKDKFLKYAQKKQSDISSRLEVFKDLKKKGLIVKTGFKFGTHFRAYTKHPNDIHAEYLIHVIDKHFSSLWAEFSRAVRLAHSVNKEIIFSRNLKNKVEYVCFGRLRP